MFDRFDAGGLTVRGDVDLVGQLGYVDLKAVLDFVQSLGVDLIRHKGDGQTFGSEPAGARHLQAEKVRLKPAGFVSVSFFFLELHRPCEGTCPNPPACRS